MNGAYLDQFRFGLGYIVSWHRMTLVSGSKNGIRRLMCKWSAK